MYPDPIFTIFGHGVYLYGICMAVGIIACFGFLIFTMKFRGFNEASADMILFIGIFGTGFGIFSATLFQAVYNYIADPSAGFNLGSMTFIGGLIGGVASFVGVYLIYIRRSSAHKNKMACARVQRNLNRRIALYPYRNYYRSRPRQVRLFFCRLLLRQTCGMGLSLRKRLQQLPAYVDGRSKGRSCTAF